MKFFSNLYPQKSGVSKNVQNYKKSPICQKPETLKNPNFGLPVSEVLQARRSGTFRPEDESCFARMYYFCNDEIT